MRPTPPAALAYSGLAFAAAVVLAAVLTPTDRSLPNAARWSMAAPGATLALLVVGDFVPALTGWFPMATIVVTLPGSAVVLAGVLLLVSARRGRLRIIDDGAPR